jgi:hypothetical protein
MQLCQADQPRVSLNCASGKTIAMETHIARQGKIIGIYKTQDIPGLLSSGEIIATDHWWQSGMKDWKMIGDEKPAEPPPLPPPLPAAPQAQQEKTPDWRLPPHHEPDPAGDMPATADQLNFINCFIGIKEVPADLTKHDAQRWIEILHASPEANRPATTEETIEQYMRTRDAYLLSFKGQTPSGSMHRMIGYHLANAEDDEDDREFSEHAIEQLMKMRVDHWLWIMKCANATNREDVLKIYDMMVSQMGMPRELINSLEKVAQNLADIPSEAEVYSMLKKLDSNHGYWDDEEPDLLIRSFVISQAGK